MTQNRLGIPKRVMYGQIQRLYQIGCTQVQIAEAFGYSRPRICEILRLLGLVDHGVLGSHRRIAIRTKAAENLLGPKLRPQES